jgi:hypothetical protein
MMIRGMAVRNVFGYRLKNSKLRDRPAYPPIPRSHKDSSDMFVSKG